MRVVFCLSLVLSLFLSLANSASPVSAQEVETHVVRGDYYEITYVGSEADAKEALAVMEAAWPLYKDFFGKAPKLKKKERLKLVVDQTQEKMASRLEELGAPNFEGGGIYLFKNKTAYSYKHPTMQGARDILLHECAHQYHYHATKLAEGNANKWFIEGVAELLSMHHWDGKKLVIGKPPLLTVDDRLEKGLAAFEKEEFSLEALVSNQTQASYPEWGALAYWMQYGDKGKNAKKYKKMRKLIESGRNGKSAFLSAFGKPKKAQAKLIEWLKKSMMPFGKPLARNRYAAALPSIAWLPSRPMPKSSLSPCTPKRRSGKRVQ